MLLQIYESHEDSSRKGYAQSVLWKKTKKGKHVFKKSLATNYQENKKSFPDNLGNFLVITSLNLLTKNTGTHSIFFFK